MAARYFPRGHSLVAGYFLAYKVAKISFSSSKGDRDESWGLGASFLGSFFLSFFYISLPKTHPKTFDSSFLLTIKR